MFRIVQAFEETTVALVSQSNFTNITVITQDVGLFAERVCLCCTINCMCFTCVSVDSQFQVTATTLLETGRTFSASRTEGTCIDISP